MAPSLLNTLPCRIVVTSSFCVSILESDRIAANPPYSSRNCFFSPCKSPVFSGPPSAITDAPISSTRRRNLHGRKWLRDHFISLPSASRANPQHWRGICRLNPCRGVLDEHLGVENFHLFVSKVYNLVPRWALHRTVAHRHPQHFPSGLQCGMKPLAIALGRLGFPEVFWDIAPICNHEGWIGTAQWKRKIEPGDPMPVFCLY